MKSGSPFAAVIATLLLHAALAAALAAGLSAHQNPPEPLPVMVRLLPPPAQPAPPEPLPVAPSPPPQKERPQPKRIARPKPAAQPRDSAAAQRKEPDVPAQSEAALPDAGAQQAQVAPAPPAPPSSSPTPTPTPPPTTPAPPARTGVSIPATYAASNNKPAYPALSRRYEEQGTVVLRVLVKADGTAGEVRLASSSGYPLLDQSAIGTVQTWRFHPATSDGKPIAEWYQVSIPFKLRD